MSKFTVVYALEEAPATYSKSIFAAGPTPRSDNPVPSWRPELLKILEASGYDGVVFIPEARDGVYCGDYMAQVSWEEKHLNMADVILFWVPRNMETMPAMTTNVEWGAWADSGRCVLGTPPEGAKNDYLRFYANKLGVPSSKTLEGTVNEALSMLKSPAARSAGERDVPLMIWNTPSFQEWYKACVRAGNRLDGAKVLSTFRVGPGRQIVFSWTMHVDVFVKAENRNKSNEFVFSRPDISSVLLYHKGKGLADTQVVLVKEFRSPVSNFEGFVYELPGGSSFTPTSPLELAREETGEETGLWLPLERFALSGARQLAATLSAHRSHLFMVELTPDELEVMSSRKEPLGNGNDSEITYVKVMTVAQILEEELCDWSTVGMIISALS